MRSKAAVISVVAACMATVGVARADISVDDVSHKEGNSGTTTFTFTVSDPDLPAGASCTIEYSTMDGTATSTDDYFATFQGFTSISGDSPAPLDVDVQGDVAEEPDETFNFNIDSAACQDQNQAPLDEPVAKGTGVGTIINDDGECFQPGVIRGTAGNDKLTGTNGPDVICGLGGNDTIRGLSGDDTLIGGSGDDTIETGTGDNFASGGDGVDRITGGKGDDLFDGGTGPDKLSGGAGNDSIMSGTGNDIVAGGAGSDSATGDEGDDVMQGGDGDDTFSGGDAQDRIFGENGNDTLSGEAGNDNFVGGKGTDSCDQGGGMGSKVACES